jgi:hypothetical protein
MAKTDTIERALISLIDKDEDLIEVEADGS